MSVNPATAEERAAGWVLQSYRTIPWLERIGRVRRSGSCLSALDELPGARSRLGRALDELARVERAGFRVVTYSDAAYPRLLRAIADPPFALTVSGELGPEDGLALSVVGSRRATRYGCETSHRLAAGLARARLTIVSGLARGIDKHAHEGALDAGGRTIAVLGSGLRNVYPREHHRLAERIAERGAVISELGLDEPPRGGNFPRRNRIITGLSLGTLVVEASLKSGSLVSARLAMEQDREVFAVPGPALSPNSEGVHALLRDGATLVTRPEDVVQELRPEVRALLSDASPRQDAVSRDAPASGAERALLESLHRAPDGVGLDHLLEDTRLSTPEALAALGRLEVEGAVWALPGGFYQLKP